MNVQIAVDRQGREWAVLALGSMLKGRLVGGTATPGAMDLVKLVDIYRPLILFPTDSIAAVRFDAFVDTVHLVASDPETASIEQIEQVAAFAKSIVLPVGRERA